MTVAERIRAVRESLPPPPTRTKRARTRHATQEEFGAMLGTDRYRVIAWENKGQIPDAEHRNRLAELSGLSADTFLPPHVGGLEISTDDLESRVAARVEERMREERQREIRELRSELRRELRREVKQEVARLREAS